MIKRVMEMVIATSNRGKREELREMLGERGIQVRGLEESAGVAEPVEDGRTLAENARIKARHYGKLVGRIVLADDSGLVVDYLGGQPGVYSARFAEGTWGNRREQDQANNRKLLRMLAGVPRENRRARFCCCLCLAEGDKILLEAAGELEGYITEEPRGENGFGYDPIFEVPEIGKTAAELTAEEKNAISHRGRALRKLVEWMKSEYK